MGRGTIWSVLACLTSYVAWDQDAPILRAGDIVFGTGFEGPGAVDGLTQARLCVRTVALLQATEGVERVYWYDLKDDGLLREFDQHGFGLIHHQQHNCAPKPGMVTLSVFSRSTAGATVSALHQQDDLYWLGYRRPDGRELIMAWVTGPDRPVRVTGEVTSAFDMMGQPLEVGDTAVLSASPVYLCGDAIRLGE